MGGSPFEFPERYLSQSAFNTVTHHRRTYPARDHEAAACNVSASFERLHCQHSMPPIAPFGA